MKVPKFEEDLWPNHVDDFDYKETEAFKKGLETVGQFMAEQSSKLTIGFLARQFPEHQSFLLDILENLRDNKNIDYVDYKPLPTIVERV